VLAKTDYNYPMDLPPEGDATMTSSHNHATVSRIQEQHQAFKGLLARIESVLGEGSAFHLRIPRKDAPPAQ